MVGVHRQTLPRLTARTVRKGDVLLQLEPEKFDRALSDLKAEVKLSELALQGTEEELAAMEKITPMELDANQRAARINEEDRKSYFDTMRPLYVRIDDFMLKMYQSQLEYEQEELRQLEKMYKADNISEETEQIVLKRAHDNVDRAKFSAEVTQVMHDMNQQYTFPRTDDQITDMARRKEIEAEKIKVTLPLALQRQRLEIERVRTQHKLLEERLKRMTADRRFLTTKATIDGIVYYGKIFKGRTSDATSMAEMFRHHNGVATNQVIMTVVQPRPMCVRTSVSENQLSDLRPGVQGTATAVAFPSIDLPATIDTVADIPSSPGSFESRVTVVVKDKPKLLMPGMSCKMKMVPYLKRDALCVPPSCIVTDEEDEHKQSIEVLDKDGKPVSRPVTVGRKTEKQVEILNGVKAGDKVVLEPSKEKK